LKSLFSLLLLSSLCLGQQHITIKDQANNTLVSGFVFNDPVTLVVTLPSTIIDSGSVLQLTTTTSNAWNTGVNWVTSAGTISSDGLFTAPTVTEDVPVFITAVSLQDSTVSASVTVTVKAPVDGPATLPQATMVTSMASTPAPGIVTQVTPGNLQTALNNAQCGDTLMLQAGGVFPGTTSFPAKSCDDQHWIIVRTNASDSSLPSEGSRMLPCYAGVASLAGRPAFTCPSTSNVLAKLIASSTIGPIVFAPGANHYRFIGLEITRVAGTKTINYELISLSSGTGTKVIFDRVWLHGSPQDDNKTGFLTNGFNHVGFIDSYGNDFHCASVIGACTDAKVIGGGTSTSADGVFKITNNFLEASGENIILGGGPATTTPADIEIRHNHFFKPLTWKAGQPGFIGAVNTDITKCTSTPGMCPFIVKNLLELKNAQRVIIDGNIFENSWGGYTQYGYAILLSPKNQTGTCPICQTTDVTIRYNTFSHLGGGISVALTLDTGFTGGLAGARYSLHDLTFDDINAATYNGNGVFFQILNSWSGYATHDITLNHITAFPDPKGKIMSLANALTNPAMYNFTVANSLIGYAQYPVWSASGTTDCASSDVPLTVFNTCFLPYLFTSNAIIGVNTTNYPATKWPAGTLFPANNTVVQFMNPVVGGDYTLLPTSPYKNAGSDGKDLGANIAAIQKAIAGAI